MTTDPHTAWLEEQIRRFTYRPGTTFILEAFIGLGGGWLTSNSNYILLVEFVAQDARRPGRTRPIRARFVIPDLVTDLEDPDHFARWMSETMIEVEVHESREWLRRDGQLVSDPHARKAAS